MIQFASNQAIREADFANAFSPVNPNGDMRAAEAFSRMVDVVPAPQVLWSDSTKRVSDVYNTIVRNANSTAAVDPNQLKTYNMAFNFLNTTQTMTDFMGNSTTQTVPSGIYKTYQVNLQSYIAAISSYRLTFNNYDLSDPKQQREWIAKEPVLSAAVNAAWNNLQQSGAPLVIQALNALTTTVNSASRDVISQAQQAMRNAALASMTVGSPPWYLAYATPSDWADASEAQNMTTMSISSSTLNQSADSSFDSWSSGASGGWGLWSVGGSASGSSSTQTFQSQATSFNLTATIGVVRIYRPWYNPILFQMQNWSVEGIPTDGISDGKGGGLMPLVPTALIVARNFQLSGTFSTEEKSHIESAVSGGASVGWGPFQVGGSYSHSESHDRLNTTFDGTTITVPGIQVIGYVNSVTPSSPPAAS
ncbi:MAG: hypothetical protein JOZ90_08600 [Alphaproteobacteria bacterium]|nr:hypothetical protein [Alphaproteobacteria bacterium]MBV9370927.1 hypothetical protein [Alphaproteobacteria bacterium]MBV9901143.1 hypothetical protein [Alphaproteobacteria bacterium]